MSNKKYFEYLNKLRAEGSTNMAGAARDLQENFGLDKGSARKILQDWMSQCSEGVKNE